MEDYRPSEKKLPKEDGWLRALHRRGIHRIPATFVPSIVPLDEGDERLFDMDYGFTLEGGGYIAQGKSEGGWIRKRPRPLYPLPEESINRTVKKARVTSHLSSATATNRHTGDLSDMSVPETDTKQRSTFFTPSSKTDGFFSDFSKKNANQIQLGGDVFKNFHVHWTLCGVRR